MVVILIVIAIDSIWSITITSTISPPNSGPLGTEAEGRHQPIGPYRGRRIKDNPPYLTHQLQVAAKRNAEPIDAVVQFVADFVHGFVEQVGFE